MQSFEAGPWEAKGTFTSDTAETMAGKLCVMSATGTVIAVTWSEDVRRMAAAAPDMSEILELFARTFGADIEADNEMPGADTVDAVCSMWPMVKAALAKVKGGAA